MKKHPILLAAAAVSTAVLAPGAAVANPPGVEARFAALTEVGADGKPVSAPLRPGGATAITLGLTFLANAPAEGVTVNVRVRGDADLPQTFSNCVYRVVATTKEAWCDIQQHIEFSTGYSLDGFRVGVVPGASAGNLPDVFFQWHPYGTRPQLKGMPGSPDPVRGSGPAVTLKKNSKLVLAAKPSDGSVPVHLESIPEPPFKTPSPAASPAITPPVTTKAPTVEPVAAKTPESKPTSVAPTASPVAEPSAAEPPATEPPASGSGGGMARTGSNIVLVAGLGVLTLVVGLAVTFLARRRRFVA